MNFGNAMYDLAERRSEEEREAQIIAARKALAGAGADDCEDCPQPIGRERRLALPSAVRCIDCQQRYERRARRR